MKLQKKKKTKIVSEKGLLLVFIRPETSLKIQDETVFLKYNIITLFNEFCRQLSYTRLSATVCRIN